MDNPAEQSMFFGLKPVANQKVSESIYEQIKDKIVSGELKPNDRLPSERNLIEVFQRSRPTIREALRMLENSGFIETLPGRGGAIIKEVTPDIMQQPLEHMILQKAITIRELYEFRIVNETAYIKWAAKRRTDEDIAIMEDLIQQMIEAKDNWDLVIHFDTEFHGAIVDSAKNEMAKIIHQSTSQPIINFFEEKFVNMTNEELKNHCIAIIQESKDMLQMIKEQKPNEAKKMMIKHLGKFNNLMN